MASNSTRLSYPAGYNAATLTIEASVSGGTVYGTATLNSGGSYWHGFSSCILSVQIDGSIVGSTQPNFYAHNESASCSGSREVGDGSHTVTAVWSNPTTNQYICASGSVSVGVSVSTASKATLSLGASTVELGGNLSIAVSTHGASPSSLTWSCLGASGSLSPGSQSWKIPVETLEPLMQTPSTLQATMTLTLSTSGYGSDSKSVIIKVPSTYLPTLKLDYIEKVDMINDSLIAGESSAIIHYITGQTPSDNTAEITRVRVASYQFVPADVGEMTFTENLEYSTITTSVFPPYQDASSYTLAMILEVTDTRGRSSQIAVSGELGRIYCYVPTAFTLANVNRCEMKVLESKPSDWDDNYSKYYVLQSGNYKKNTNPTFRQGEFYTQNFSVAGTFAYIEAQLSIVEQQPEDKQMQVHEVIVYDEVRGEYITYELEKYSDTKYSVIIGDYNSITGKGSLKTDRQYPLTAYIQSVTMYNYGDPALTQSSVIPTMMMPISLYDDGNRVGISVGEMSTNYDEVSAGTFLNFTQDLQMRATGPDGEAVVANAYDVISGGTGCPFPVGSIFLTMDEKDPSEIWFGTLWTMIAQNRMLLGAGYDYEVGDEGGEAEHTLTIAEMPAHTHTVTVDSDGEEETCDDNYEESHSVPHNNVNTRTTSSVGGGQAHNNMPPYLAVYMWKRIADPIRYYFTVTGFGEYDFEEGMTWSEFVASTYNPTIEDSQYKKFKIETHPSLGTVISIGEKISPEDEPIEVVYEKQIYANNNLVLPANAVMQKYKYKAEAEGIEWDLIDNNVYDEIDVLYTTDVHGAWVGYAEYPSYGTAVFNYDDVDDYRTTLAENNIKAVIVDGGDWSHGSDRINASEGKDASDEMNEKEYLLSVYGNHEWKWGGSSKTMEILNRCDSMTACNFLQDGQTVFKPYRAIKVSGKKIAFIGVGYPSPNGSGTYNNGVWTYEGYQFYDANKLYTQVQNYIDFFKSKNFDKIICVTHMCKASYEEDSRYIARTDTLAQNTQGLDVMLQGHFNQQTPQDSVNNVYFAPEAGAVMNCFGRLRLMNDGTVSAYLLTNRSQLDVV